MNKFYVITNKRPVMRNTGVEREGMQHVPSLIACAAAEFSAPPPCSPSFRAESRDLCKRSESLPRQTNVALLHARPLSMLRKAQSRSIPARSARHGRLLPFDASMSAADRRRRVMLRVRSA